MNHKRLTAIVVAGAALAAIALFYPAGKPDHEGGRQEDGGIFPWQITVTADGGTRVFGLQIGRSTLHDAENRFQEEAEISQFVTDNGRYVTEGYFDRVELGGLGAKAVAAAALPQNVQEEMFKRGLRISSMGGGRRKVTLSPEDVERVRAAPIGTLTYLPSSRLDEQVVRKRFGEPARTVREQRTEVTHWLYPRLGLDVALSPKEKPVLQYVPPSEFGRLEAPLLQDGKPAP